MIDDKNPVQLNGKVKVDKSGEGKKFLKLFFAGSFIDALKYAFESVFIPYTKDAICRTSTNVVSYWVNGDKPVQTNNIGANRVSYWQGQSNRVVGYPSQTQVVKPVSNVYTYGTLYFEDRGDAEAVLLRLKEALVQYHVVSVADLFDLAGEKSAFTDNKYGWRNLDNAHVTRTLEGRYVIDLPKAMPLD